MAVCFFIWFDPGFCMGHSVAVKLFNVDVGVEFFSRISCWLAALFLFDQCYEPFDRLPQLPRAYLEAFISSIAFVWNLLMTVIGSLHSSQKHF